jgi:hypothetical protein
MSQVGLHFSGYGQLVMIKNINCLACLQSFSGT